MTKASSATVSELRQALSSVNVINCATKETVPFSQVRLPAWLPVCMLVVSYSRKEFHFTVCDCSHPRLVLCRPCLRTSHSYST